jgi:hypothetical protein
VRPADHRDVGDVGVRGQGTLDFAVEAVRVLMVAKRSARPERTQRSTRPGPSS